MHADWIKLSGQIKLKKMGKLIRGPHKGINTRKVPKVENINIGSQGTSL